MSPIPVVQGRASSKPKIDLAVIETFIRAGIEKLPVDQKEKDGAIGPIIDDVRKTLGKFVVIADEGTYRLGEWASSAWEDALHYLPGSYCKAIPISLSCPFGEPPAWLSSDVAEQVLPAPWEAIALSLGARDIFAEAAAAFPPGTIRSARAAIRDAGLSRGLMCAVGAALGGSLDEPRQAAWRILETTLALFVAAAATGNLDMMRACGGLLDAQAMGCLPLGQVYGSSQNVLVLVF